MSTDHRWTIRGIHPDLQNLVAVRAQTERKTVGELVTEALAAYMGKPVASEVTETLLERVLTLEGLAGPALSSLSARVASLEALVKELSARQVDPAPRPTVVTAERPTADPAPNYRARGVIVTPDIVELVKRLTAEGRSQRQTAADAGISTGTVSNILNGRFD